MFQYDEIRCEDAFVEIELGEVKMRCLQVKCRTLQDFQYQNWVKVGRYRIGPPSPWIRPRAT